MCTVERRLQGSIVQVLLSMFLLSMARASPALRAIKLSQALLFPLAILRQEI